MFVPAVDLIIDIWIFFLGVNRRLILKISQITILTTLSIRQTALIVNFVSGTEIVAAGEGLAWFSATE